MQVSLNLSRIGNGGTRKATVLLYGIAMNHFKQFLLYIISQLLILKPHSPKEESLAFANQETMFFAKRFLAAVWSFSMRSKKTNGEFLSSGVGKDYFGQAKETIRKMYETNPIWREHSLKKGEKLVAGSKVCWFTRIRNELEKTLKGLAAVFLGGWEREYTDTNKISS